MTTTGLAAIHACPLGDNACRCSDPEQHVTGVQDLALAFLAAATDWAEAASQDAFTDPERAACWLALARIALTVARRVAKSEAVEVRP